MLLHLDLLEFWVLVRLLDLFLHLFFFEVALLALLLLLELLVRQLADSVIKQEISVPDLLSWNILIASLLYISIVELRIFCAISAIRAISI